MSDGKLTGGTLTPAYGRDYKSGADARRDFEAGKDFILNTYGGGRNGPCGSADFVPGSRVVIRFGQLRKIIGHVVGSTVPAAKPRAPRKNAYMSTPSQNRKPAGPRVIMNIVPADVAFRVDVYADDSGKPAGNALRFATRDECEAYARDLAGRWFLVRRWEVLEGPGPVTHRWTADGLRSV